MSAARKKAESAPDDARRVRITLVRSTIGRPVSEEDTVRSLGLKRLHQTVELPDNDSVAGMINKVRHLVVVDTV